jgi:hypothetical protein
MSLQQIVTMGFREVSSHGHAVGGHLAGPCALDEENVSLGTRVLDLFGLVNRTRREWLQLKGYHVEGTRRESRRIRSSKAAWMFFFSEVSERLVGDGRID